MSFTKYPKNYHANGYGWHNMAAMGYAKPPPTLPSSNNSFSSGVSSIYPSAPARMPMPTPGVFANTGPAMPPLPNSPYSANVGVQLSYGFAPSIEPAQIPNVPRADSIDSGPKLGWNIGGVGGGSSSSSIPSRTSIDSGVHDPIKAQQEVPCQSIFVPDEDRPIYSMFGFPSVSLYNDESTHNKK